MNQMEQKEVLPLHRIMETMSVGVDHVAAEPLLHMHAQRDNIIAVAVLNLFFPEVYANDHRSLLVVLYNRTR